MDRREFLRACARAGISAAAAGAFLDRIARRTAGQIVAGDGGGGGAGPLFIKLHGDPKEMGRQYAAQAGDLIIDRLKRFREKGSKIPAEAVDQSRIFLAVSAKSVMTEIEYCASKLNERSDDLLRLSAEMPGAGIRQAGCSSFAIDAKAAQDGKVWAGQNIDDASELEKYGVVIMRHQHDTTPTLTWTLAGSVGGIGMNWEGLSLTMNYLQSSKQRMLAAIFPEFVAACALRQTTFKDASAVLANTPLMGPCSFILSDTAGTRLVLERTPHMFRGSTPGTLYATHTNHFLDKDLKDDDTTDKVFPNTRGRLKRLNALLDRKDLTLELLQRVLADTEGKPHGICRHADPRTIASVIMCPEQHKMWVTQGLPDRTKYQEFELFKRWD